MNYEGVSRFKILGFVFVMYIMVVLYVGFMEFGKLVVGCGESISGGVIEIFNNGIMKVIGS